MSSIEPMKAPPPSGQVGASGKPHQARYFHNGRSTNQVVPGRIDTSWRDTKTAILVFNRGRALSTVLEKIGPTVAAHANYVREVQYGGETAYRFVLSHRDDAARHLTLTVLVFELPA